MRVCGRCHREAPTDALFCPFCGGAIKPTGPGAESDPLIGTTIADKYFVHQLLGHGGMGDVYKATHLTLDRPVAVKLLKKSLCAEPEIVYRFHREARAASRLNHPNSITIIDFGEAQDGRLFIAMEYLAGRSLGTVIAEQWPLTEARVVHIGAQILAALAEAHALGIIHRDLKPTNVMLEPRREDADFVKVLDFGIAKLNDPGDRATHLTRAGMVCGTPGYMSPEQVRGDELDARSDLYAVGVILYEMIAGCELFEADTPMALCTKHLVEEPPPISHRRPGVACSSELEALLMRALAKDPAARPASADEMRAQLLACEIRGPLGARSTPAALPKRTEFFGPMQPGPPATPASSASPAPRTPAPRDPAAGGVPAPPRVDAPGTSPADASPRPPASTPGTTSGARPSPPPRVATRPGADALEPPVGEASPQQAPTRPLAAPVPLPTTPFPATARAPTPRPSRAPDSAPQPPVERASVASPETGGDVGRDDAARSGASAWSRRKAGAIAIAAIAIIAGVVWWLRPRPPPPDQTPPKISSTAPVANASDVHPGTTISITFSEPMEIGSVRIRTEPPSSFTRTVWSPDGTSATVTPERPLAIETRYTVFVEGADRAGNRLDARPFEFDTERRAEPPVPPPAVVETSPANGSKRVDLALPVRIKFSRQMNRDSVVLKLNGHAVSRVRWTDGDTVAAFTPPTLAHDSWFEAEVWGSDVDGRMLGPVMPFSFSFRTGSARPAPIPTPPRPTARILERRAGLKSIPTPMADTGEAVIAVDATPWATVYVNDEKVLETPCSIRVTAASYRLRAEYLSRPAQLKNVTVSAGGREVWTVSFAR